MVVNSAQAGCIVKAEAQKSPLFWRFSVLFLFFEDRLLSRNFTRQPLACPSFPCFFWSPARISFFCCLSVCPFFSRHFRGSVGTRKSLFFWWFSLSSSKKQGKEGQGKFYRVADFYKRAPVFTMPPICPLLRMGITTQTQNAAFFFECQGCKSTGTQLTQALAPSPRGRPPNRKR